MLKRAKNTILSNVFRFASHSNTPLKRTPFYHIQKALGGEFVDFCGWEMPIKFEGNQISDEVHQCRNKASLFDVSHMGQLVWHGEDREKFLASITPCDIDGLGYGRTKLSVLLSDDENGTILDDLMITRHYDHCFMVVNAATKENDIKHFEKKIAESGMDVSFTDISADRGLLALQGPKAVEALQRHVTVDLRRLPFMCQVHMEIEGVPCFVSRCGYTGEDGFEISIPLEQANDIAAVLLSEEDVAPTGLGARDTLRLEAGLCLYGNEIDTTTTPVEGNLLWLITKRRRKEGGFPGFDRIKDHMENGTVRKRIGFISKGAPAREHATIYDADGNVIGEVTSGTWSPVLNKPIGMGYVDTSFAKKGTKIFVEVRGRKFPATVEKMPFIPSGFYRIPDSMKPM
ncbi:hypothetical protein PCE1_002414 [Barthelona sp. PCE]